MYIIEKCCSYFSFYFFLICFLFHPYMFSLSCIWQVWPIEVDLKFLEPVGRELKLLGKVTLHNFRFSFWSILTFFQANIFYVFHIHSGWRLYDYSRVLNCRTLNKVLGRLMWIKKNQSVEHSFFDPIWCDILQLWLSTNISACDFRLTSVWVIIIPPWLISWLILYTCMV